MSRTRIAIAAGLSALVAASAAGAARTAPAVSGADAGGAAARTAHGPAASASAKAPATTAPGKPGAVAFDLAFIDAMIPHHQAALAMARAAQKEGLKQAAVKKVARDVLRTQAQEIARLKAWRKNWYGAAPVLSAAAAGKALGLSPAAMGMAHDAGELAGTADADAAFADMMVPHHQGAVTMAKLALRKARHPELKKLARAIIAAQEAEIMVLQHLGSGGMDMSHG